MVWEKSGMHLIVKRKNAPYNIIRDRDWTGFEYLIVSLKVSKFVWSKSPVPRFELMSEKDLDT